MQTQTLNLYDFDGVLADPLEEALFSMPATKHDFEFVERVSKRHNMNLKYESPQSARYICMQAVLWCNRIHVKPGPITPDFKTPYYILTARSDRFAVRRMHEFIRDELCVVPPIKTQHLDHLPKGQAIAVLLERHPDVCFRFYDDNPRHILSARLLRSERVEVIQVDNDMKPLYEEAETFYKDRILELSL